MVPAESPFCTPVIFEKPPLFFLPPHAEIEKNPLIPSGKLRSRTRNGSNAPRSTYACPGGLPCCRGCPLAVLAWWSMIIDGLVVLVWWSVLACLVVVWVYGGVVVCCPGLCSGGCPAAYGLPMGLVYVVRLLLLMVGAMLWRGSFCCSDGAICSFGGRLLYFLCLGA